MTGKEPDRLEIKLGKFQASAVGKMAVAGLLMLIGVFLVVRASGVL